MKKYVCKDCGAKMTEYKEYEEVNQFAVGFACGRRVYTNPFAEPQNFKVQTKGCKAKK